MGHEITHGNIFFLNQKIFIRFNQNFEIKVSTIMEENMIKMVFMFLMDNPDFGLKSKK